MPRPLIATLIFLLPLLAGVAGAANPSGVTAAPLAHAGRNIERVCRPDRQAIELRPLFSLPAWPSATSGPCAIPGIIFAAPEFQALFSVEPTQWDTWGLMFKGTPGPLADRHLDADEKHTVLEATARYYQRLFEGALGRKRDDRNFTRPIIGAWERERRRREKAVEIGWAMLDTPVHIGTALVSGGLMTDATCGAAWTWNGFASGGGWGLGEVGRGGRGFALAMAMIPAGRIENVADDVARVGLRAERGLARGLAKPWEAKGGKKLIHLTDAAGEAGIGASNSLRGTHGIFAVPSNVTVESTAMKVGRTGLTPDKTTNFVNIPEAANSLFTRPVPIGPYSAWKYFGGVRYAPAGSINMSTGTFSASGSLIGPRTLIYGPDALFYGGAAAIGGAYYYETKE